MRILVVEDDTLLADGIVEALRIESYAVDLAREGVSAENLMYINTYDLVILDWTIPPPTGIELLRSWRVEENTTPVLMLTGRAEVDDCVTALDSGADDYLNKPFSLSELFARVRSLLRRRGKPLQVALKADDLELDRVHRLVSVAGKPVETSPKEFAMLEYLITRQDEIITRTELIEHVWDEAFDSMSNPVDVVIYRLRKKIDGNRLPLLHTKKGVGYVLASQRA
ncbi:MAG: response regulator transcription factor [Gammaproteobacteria bacterium]|nr:response regulator transcription factor [Gammaproteobacteria bacterium]